MKYLLALFWIVAASALSGQSLQTKPPEERARIMTDSMRIYFQLSPAQTEKVAELNLRYARIMEKEVMQSGKNAFGKYTAGMKINNQKETELKKILTGAQFALYEKQKKKAMGRIWQAIF